VASPIFLLSVAFAAGLTVILATVLSFPSLRLTINRSTGRAVVLVAAGSQVNFAKLGSTFFLPLLLSPIIAVALGGTIYLIAHAIRVKSGVTKEWCICVGEATSVVPITEPASIFASAAIAWPSIAIATKENCHQQYCGGMMGVSVQKVVDSLHFLSAGSVSFARGLNDTAKNRGSTPWSSRGWALNGACSALPLVWLSAIAQLQACGHLR